MDVTVVKVDKQTGGNNQVTDVSPPKGPEISKQIYKSLSEQRQMRQMLEAVCSKEDPTVLCEIEEYNKSIGVLGDVCRTKLPCVRSEDPALYVGLEHYELQPLIMHELVDELMIARELHHPNIPEIYEMYLPRANKLSIMSELVNTIDLEDLVRWCPMDEQQIATISMNMCRALQCIPGERFMPITRSDVAVTAKAEVKLVGLGSYTVLPKQGGSYNSGVDSCPWVSPEIIRGEEYDTKTDIWSLGIVTMEMLKLVGDNFFSIKDPQETLRLVCSNGFPRLSPSNPSSELSHFLSRCLCVDASERASADELLKHEFLRNAGTSECLIPLVSAATTKREEQKEKRV